jgi:hypothetical protein
MATSTCIDTAIQIWVFAAFSLVPSLPIDKSVCNPKPKSSCKAERNPFNVGHNDLASYNNAKARARACAFLHAVIILISKFLDEVSVEAPSARTGVRQV